MTWSARADNAVSRRIAQNYYNRSDYRRDSLTRTQCGLNEDSLGDHFHAGQLFLSRRDTAQPLFPRLSLFLLRFSLVPASTQDRIRIFWSPK